MEKWHHLCALAHRRGDLLFGARPDVPDREHAGEAGLQRPPALAGPGAGQDETPIVESDRATRQPSGVGIGAYEQEEMADREAALLISAIVAPCDSFEHAAFTLDGDDLATKMHLYMGKAAMRWTR